MRGYGTTRLAQIVHHPLCAIRQIIRPCPTPFLLARSRTTATDYIGYLQKASVKRGVLAEGEIMTKADYKFWTKKDLIDRIKELEALSGSVIEDSKVHAKSSPAAAKKAREGRQFNFSAHSTRYIGLKFAYMGWNYNGLNVQLTPTPLPTVEGLILKALYTCKLIASADDLEGCEFNRCGRTDKGVSALAQVISLRVRSKLTPEEQQDPANDNNELSYITMLNNLLPPDIRFYQVCLHPPADFNARFSCKSRHYKYFFISQRKKLNIEAMREAAAAVVGVHDFRNLCKIDGSKQLTNFTREIFESSIEFLDHKYRNDSTDDIYVFNLKGSAFLWHQVRCIMGVLLLVGQGLEQPDIMKELLDVERYPRKPVYTMAYEVPLVLYDCEFDENVKWKGLSDFYHKYAASAMGTLRADAYGLWYDGIIKNELQFFMRNVIESQTDRQVTDTRSARIQVDVGDGMGRWFSEYVPLEKRELMDSFEVLNDRWLSRKIRVSAANGHVNGNAKHIEDRNATLAAQNEVDGDEKPAVQIY